MSLFAYLRLARAAFVLAREGALSVVPIETMPPAARAGIAIGRLLERRDVRRTGRVERLTRALNRLGPTYVKFGQTLATRPDIVGFEVAADLAALQDRMDPFDPALVPGILAEALGPRAAELRSLSVPVAAASIAQVHIAQLTDRTGVSRKVAVKLLRPGVEQRFRADLESYHAAARAAERLLPGTRRLKPSDVVAILERSARLELDLRFEAAAISEFSQNIAGDDGFSVPEVFWDHSSRDVLVTGFVDALPIKDHAGLDAGGADRRQIARNLMQNYLRHAIRDGFFHADMHPGNLFADPRTNGVIAVDFGIMGRLGREERRFLADILYGFITRDYRLVAQRHFDIGYVPADQSVDDFSLAIRSIGEPLHGRTAGDISMGRVLGQLFAITDMFSMRTRPELVLLQKSMVLVEGVARGLDPDLNIWTIAEPVVGDWIRREEGPLGRLERGRDEITRLVSAVTRVPKLVQEAERLLVETNRRHARPAPLPRPLVAALGWLGLVALVLAIARLLLW